MTKYVAILALVLGQTQLALADDSQVNQSKESKDSLAPANKVDGAQSADDILTNANLRAMSGSTSKWSIASSFTYDGGSLAAPFAEGRPNIAGASATSTDTDVNGQLNIKYNMNAVNAMLLGFGIRKMAPFSASGPTKGFYDQGGKDMDAFDPSLTYQHIYKMGIVQSVLQIGFMQYTRQDIVVGQGLDKALSFDQENIIEIGDTGLSVGGSIGFSGNTTNGQQGEGVGYSQYQVWLSPYAEYKISEKVNLRTVSNLWVYEFYPIGIDGVQLASQGWNHDYVTQSVGVGFSITRDIFLYPNVQFLPDRMSAGLTNVGITATINLF